MPQDTLISFSLQDQFGNAHSSAAIPADQLVIILGGDKDGSKHAGDCARAILAELDARGTSDAIKNKLKWLPVADLKIVPSLLRWMVKQFLPSDPKETVALDWKGEFNTAYGWTDSKANVMLFGKGPERKLLYFKAVEALSEEERKAIVELILANA